MKKKFTVGKKLNSEILSVRTDGKIGGFAEGFFGELKPMLTHAGETVRGNFDQELHTMTLTDFETGEIKTYWADGGIRGSLKLARIENGQPIRIVHTGEKKIDEGRVQTYDVFRME